MTLEGFGLSIELPDGWNGRIYTETEGPDAPNCSILQAATVSIPSYDDCILTAARQLFGSNDASVMLFETPGGRPGFDTLYPVTTLLALGPSHYMPVWQGITPGQATFVRRLRLNGRYFQLQAVFGSSPTVTQLSQVNQVLSTLQVGTPVPV